MRKLGTVVSTTAAALALALGGLATPMAGAADQSANLVTFGDSMTANPTINPLHPFAAVDPTASERTPVGGFGRGCAQDNNNWPRVVSRSKSWDLADYSCNGTGDAKTLLSDIDRSISEGKLGENTQAVVLMYGVLDPTQWVEATAGLAGLELPDIALYKSTIQEAAQRIRGAAPQARIVLSSYQEITSSDSVCPVNAIPQNPTAIPIPGLDNIQVSMHNAMQQAAQRANIAFYDLLAATRGHGMCATPDDQRYVAAVVDLTAQHNMKFHPTINGQRAVGDLLSAYL